MDKKINMNFFVERDSALKYSRSFIIARAVIISLPLLYIAYIAYCYFSYSSAYTKANERITELQDRLASRERELKNTRVVINDFDTFETMVKKGFFYDGETPFSDTLEISFTPELKEKTLKFEEAVAQSLKKTKTSERAIMESLFKNAGEFGGEVKIGNIKIDFSTKKMEFQMNCAAKDTYLRLVDNLKACRWIGQIFVSSLKASAGGVSAYIIISLKEAELFE